VSSFEQNTLEALYTLMFKEVGSYLAGMMVRWREHPHRRVAETQRKGLLFSVLRASAVENAGYNNEETTRRPPIESGSKHGPVYSFPH
jgi:hypothetical protein